MSRGVRTPGVIMSGRQGRKQDVGVAEATLGRMEAGDCEFRHNLKYT